MARGPAARKAGQGTAVAETEPAASARIISIQGGAAGSGGQVWPAAHVEDIPPKPIRRLHISEDEAEKLAKLPRKNKNWDEIMSVAFGGMVGAFPPAVAAIHAGSQRQPFSLEAFENIEVGIFVVFTVWFFVWLVAQRRAKVDQTSVQLLEELRKGPDETAQRPQAVGASGGHS